MLKSLVRSGFNNAGITLFRSDADSDEAVLYRLDPFRHQLFLSDDEVRPFLRFCDKSLSRSHSQLLQDLFVLYALDGKRNGFFVDFGAADGVELSNSLLLERDYGWRGIVAEPARGWHAALRANRHCEIETDCVSARSGETLVFNETSARGLSTLDAYSRGDRHADARADGSRYEVQTVSLNDMLARHGAPSNFDYLSIDTEGSELDILYAFDLAHYRPRVITVEHNYEDGRRAAIHALLTNAGYKRKFEAISMFDDWYLLASS